MNVNFWVILAVSVLLIACGGVILLGRGDWLISGYNTASEQKRERYNISRLRLITGVMCIYVAVVMVIGYYVENEPFIAYTILPAAVLYIVLSYTWARRK